MKPHGPEIASVARVVAVVPDRHDTPLGDVPPRPDKLEPCACARIIGVGGVEITLTHTFQLEWIAKPDRPQPFKASDVGRAQRQPKILSRERDRTGIDSVVIGTVKQTLRIVVERCQLAKGGLTHPGVLARGHDLKLPVARSQPVASDRHRALYEELRTRHAIFVAIDVDEREREHVERALDDGEERSASEVARILEDDDLSSLGYRKPRQLRDSGQKFWPIDNLVDEDPITKQKCVDHRTRRDLVGLQKVLVREQHHEGRMQKRLNPVEDGILARLLQMTTCLASQSPRQHLLGEADKLVSHDWRGYHPAATMYRQAGAAKKARVDMAKRRSIYSRSPMAARWKTIESEEEIRELEVRLPTVAGVAPARYLPLVYASALLLALAILLLLPGITRYGTRFTITSAPLEAAVFVDGVRIGVTPLDVFVPAGDHEIAVVRGAQRITYEPAVGGRRLGSVFFPRRDQIVARFTDAAAATGQRTGVQATGDASFDSASVAVPVSIADALAGIAAISLLGGQSAQFQHPPVAHNLARTLWADSANFGTEPFAPDAQGSPTLASMTAASLIAHASESQARDVTAALLRLANGGGVVTPGSIAQIVSFFVQLESNSPGVLLARERLALTIAPSVTVDDSEWMERAQERADTATLAASLGLDEQPPPPIRRRSLSGLPFVEVPGGTYIVGYPLRTEGVPTQIADLQPFLILDRELSRSDFSAFLVTPDGAAWAPEARPALIAAGRATYDYLADWPSDWRARVTDSGDTWGNESLRNVSWYAAAAFARWVSARTPGYVLRLPTAVEAEYAAFLDGLGAPEVNVGTIAPLPSDDLRAGALGARQLIGNLWEWTDDWHSQTWPLLEPAWGEQRIVTGGGFASANADHRSRGAQPPDWATPFLGFRLVAVQTP